MFALRDINLLKVNMRMILTTVPFLTAYNGFHACLLAVKHNSRLRVGRRKDAQLGLLMTTLTRGEQRECHFLLLVFPVLWDLINHFDLFIRLL